MRPSPRPGGLDPDLDARLVARCQAGEPRAWEALVRRHQRLVWAVARAYRMDDEDRGDVFQEVFAALVRALPRMRDGRALVRWLSVTTDRIARTTALRRRREQAARVTPTDGDAIGLDALAAPDAPAGADLERLEREAMVRLGLAGLSERCRRLLLALYFEDPRPAYGTLAERLGVPVGSLGPTRARCFDRLREGLAAFERGGADDAAGINRTPPPTSPDDGASRRGAALHRARPAPAVRVAPLGTDR